MSPNTSTTHHRKRTQPTLYKLLGENNTATLKEETQPATKPVKEGELRVYFQNTHGIKSTTKEWGETITKIVRNKIGIFGFAETNTNWTPIIKANCLTKAKQAVIEQTGNRTNLSMSTASCSGWLGGEYQPGGTCTCAVGGWATRITKKEEDPDKLGRWCSISLQLNEAEVTFITAYRVGKAKIDIDNKAYTQQWK
jgi:hypothetical protein